MRVNFRKMSDDFAEIIALYHKGDISLEVFQERLLQIFKKFEIDDIVEMCRVVQFLREYRTLVPGGKLSNSITVMENFGW